MTKCLAENKGLSHRVDIVELWWQWTIGCAPFFFINGRMFTIMPVQGENWVRVFEHLDTGAVYHIEDYPVGQNGRIDMESLITRAARLDPENKEVQTLIAHFVTNRIIGNKTDNSKG